MRIPRMYSFTLREVFILAVLIFLFGITTGQVWRIAQVEPYYEKEVKSISSRQEQSRKKMANVERRIMDIEKKLNIPWKPYADKGIAYQ